MNLPSRLRLNLLVPLIVSLLDASLALGIETDLAMARNAYKEKNYTQVTEALMPILVDLKKEDLLILGKSYDKLEKPLLAMKVYSAGAAKYPKDSEMKSLLGYEQFRANNSAEAILTLKEVTDADKKYQPAYEFLIQIFEKKQNRYELRLVYQDLIDRIGEKPEFVTKMCENSVLDSQYELALKYCQLGVSQSPKDAANQVYLGLVYRETGKMEEATKLLKRAADSFSKSELAQITYAELNAGKKNHIEAFKYYSRALQANPDSQKALLGVGVSGMEIQKLAEALTAFEKACKADKASTLFLRRAINLLRAAKNQNWLEKYEAALDHCR